MGKISIPIKVNIPDQMEMGLVRSDYYDLSNVFRIAFEIALAFFSGILGSLLTKWPWSVQEGLLVFITITFIVFTIILTIRYYKRSKQHELETDGETGGIPFKKIHLAVNIPAEKQKDVDTLLEKNSPKIAFKWHINAAKMTHSTLKIFNIDSKTLISILDQFKEADIQYIDEKIILV